ncbi:MAG: AraC family transcriptional regulator [Burkholderiaceae bacterium]|nr:AraC family transcriptional regulator [Burkholderiaceae bacterium]
MKRTENILQVASKMNIEWYESEYFIMPDIPLPPYPNNSEGDIFLGFYVLFICVAGEAELIINNTPTKIEQSCLYALSPGSKIEPKSQSEDCRLRILSFTKDFLLKNNFTSNALTDFDFFTKNQFNKITVDPDEAPSLLQLYDFLKTKEQNNNRQSAFYVEIIRSLFFTFLYEVKIIYSNHAIPKTPRNNRDKELNIKFKEILTTQAKMQHGIKFYADSLFITPKHLISAIKNTSGKTPKEMIDERIIGEAKQYLVHTHYTIGHIADLLQFPDLATFSKFFKRHTLLSPSAYRKKHP